jgi:hypothetical protein
VDRNPLAVPWSGHVPTPKAKTTKAATGTPVDAAHVRPTRAAGAGGTAIWGGIVATRETNAQLVGQQRHRTEADLLLNNGDVAAACRFLLALGGRPEWRFVAPEGAPAIAEEYARLMGEMIGKMQTPWKRVVRRALMALPRGHSVQEIIARLRPDGVFGLDDIASRPNHTIEKWWRDRNGRLVGIGQRDIENVAGGAELPVPLWKCLYLADSDLTDDPRGVGLLRQSIDTAHRIKHYRRYEAIGVESNMGGSPKLKWPLAELARLERDGTPAEQSWAAAQKAVASDIVANHVKGTDSGWVIDSKTYDDGTGNPSAVPMYDIEILRGDHSAMEPLSNSIERERQVLHILWCTQVLLTTKGGSNALSKQQAMLALIAVESELEGLRGAVDRSLVRFIGTLNDWPEELWPHSETDPIALDDVMESALALKELEVLLPNDPAHNAMRRKLGVPPRPEEDPDADAELGADRAGKPDADAEDMDPDGEETGEEET